MPPQDQQRATRAYRAAVPVDEEDIHPGAVVGEGRFEIVGIIGRGAMASVFRARDHRRNTDIALKVLSRKHVGRVAKERRFDNEVRLGGRLHGHRNVVAPLEAGRLEDRGGRMFLTMELVHGPSLSDLVAMHGPLSVDDACMYLRDVARALRDLHQGGVVHRDIKPDNVIVVNTAKGRVAKLLDFGLAADMGAATQKRHTRFGERPGTPHYMSPEQAWDAPAHPVFDIYSLGVSFYEVLTGHPPFFELEDADVITRKCDLKQPAPSIDGKREDLPPRLVALINGCLEPVAKKRLPSINAFLKRLDGITDELGGGMKPRVRQETAMVGQARTVDPVRRKKSRLPEIMAEAAARKQQAATGQAPPVEATAASSATAAPAAAAPPRPAPAQPVGQYPAAPPAPHGAAPYTAPRPYPTPAAHAPKTPRRAATNRAVVVGLVLGAVLSALLVLGVWLWIRP